MYPTAGFDVKIGIRYNGSGREFTGAIDDVRIYNRVLSDAEVAWLAGPVLIRLTLFA
ncbi:MAG: LamG-like jellyroll fold domain-containing protein, partial [Planctomycetota bacterium]